MQQGVIEKVSIVGRTGMIFLKRSNILFWQTAIRNTVRSLFSYASNSALVNCFAGRFSKILPNNISAFSSLGKSLPYLSFLYYKS